MSPSLSHYAFCIAWSGTPVPRGVLFIRWRRRKYPRKGKSPRLRVGGMSSWGQKLGCILTFSLETERKGTEPPSQAPGCSVPASHAPDPSSSLRWRLLAFNVEVSVEASGLRDSSIRTGFLSSCPPAGWFQVNADIGGREGSNPRSGTQSKHVHSRRCAGSLLDGVVFLSNSILTNIRELGAVLSRPL